LEQFDKELYENQILFNINFNESITDAYKKRNNDIISKNELVTLLVAKGRLKPPKSNPKQTKSTLKGDGNTQSKEDYSKEEENRERKIKKENWLSIEEYIEFREYEFSQLEERLLTGLKLHVNIERPYCWVNRKMPCGYFDLVDCIVRVKDDVEWRASIQQNNSITKDQFLLKLYEFVNEIKDSTIYKSYDGYDGADGKENFITHFTRWLRKKNFNL